MANLGLCDTVLHPAAAVKVGLISRTGRPLWAERQLFGRRRAL